MVLYSPQVSGQEIEYNFDGDKITATIARAIERWV